MVQKTAYDRVQDPNLSRLQESVVRGLRNLAEGKAYPYGQPTVLIKGSGGLAYGRFHRVDVRQNSVTIDLRLPTIKKEDIGRSIFVAEVKGGFNVATIIATGGDVIDGVASKTITAYEHYHLLAADVGQWITV